MQACVGGRKSESGVAREQFVQESSTRAPEAEQEDRRLWADLPESLCKALLLDLAQQRMARTSQRIEHAGTPIQTSPPPVDSPGQSVPRFQC